MAIDGFPVVIVGCGPGSPEYLTAAGRAEIETADVLVGAPRLLESFSMNRAEQISIGKDITAALAAMDDCVGRKRVVVLVTGDPGLYSLAQPVIRHFGRRFCRVIPGISTVQTAFARIGVDWEDARVLSLHGRNPGIDPGSVTAQRKIAILIEGEASRPWLAALGRLLDATHEAFVCTDLTLERERTDCVKPAALATIPLQPRSIILFIEKELLW